MYITGNMAFYYKIKIFPNQSYHNHHMHIIIICTFIVLFVSNSYTESSPPNPLISLKYFCIIKGLKILQVFWRRHWPPLSNILAAFIPWKLPKNWFDPQSPTLKRSSLEAKSSLFDTVRLGVKKPTPTFRTQPNQPHTGGRLYSSRPSSIIHRPILSSEPGMQILLGGNMLLGAY